MTDGSKKEAKKIIIDEDWKSQVEAEKEAARQQQEAQRPAEEEEEEEAASLPPADLTFLAGNLYLQAMMALGLLPNPASGKPEVNLRQAKHAIDTLQMLEGKTEGNRTPEETREIDNMLHELRLAYVGVQEARQASRSEPKE